MKYLITGLGNPGSEYENTRHNIGFSVLDFLAQKEGLNSEQVRHGSLAQYKFKGRTILLLKPNTFMNLSGKAVQYWLQQEKSFRKSTRHYRRFGPAIWNNPTSRKRIGWRS